MTLTNISNKRSFDQTGNAPKRLKDWNPTQEVLHESQPLSEMLLSQFALAELGSYACTSKASYSSAQPYFLFKARALGFNPQDSFQAIEKMKNLFQHVHTLRECGKCSPTKTNEEIAFGFSKKIGSILGFLIQPVMYKNPHHPVLELLESESSWRHSDSGAFAPSARKSLAYATYYKRPQLVARLLKYGAEPTKIEQITHPSQPARMLPQPLQTAILVDDMPSVQLLLDYGANLNIRTIRGFAIIENTSYEIPGMSVLQYALGSAHARTYYPEARLNRPMIEFLLDKGAQVTPDDLIDAAETCSIETLQRLMHPFTRLDPESATDAFSRVVKIYGQLETSVHQMLEFLLNQGAEVNGRSSDYPLHEACASGSLELVKYLVSKKADLTLVNAELMTPLSIAVLRGDLEIVHFLLESKAKVNQQWTLTALTYTCFTADDKVKGYRFASNNPKLVKLLLSYGADPQPEGCDEGESPMERAKKNGLTEIVQIFEKHKGIS